ncbi:MAG: carboxylating nicotinate-nucleotide diphosphorylase [bacterium]
MYSNMLNSLLDIAIKEDIGDGDHTSLSSIPHEKNGESYLLVKQDGILAGMRVAKEIFKKFNNSLEFKPLMDDGQAIKVGDIPFRVEGKVIDILMAERLVLNIMQRMSGIATSTREYTKQLIGLKTRVLDTRKTSPGLRFLEKEAVRIGGGVNHRFGLYDMILLKDNHIDFAGGIKQAIEKVHEYLEEKNKKLFIEIEARSLDDVEKILVIGGIHRIMLDNFSLKETKTAVDLINGQYETESSGGINLKTIRPYAECGVDFVSVGALTHQANSLDLSLKADI